MLRVRTNEVDVRDGVEGVSLPFALAWQYVFPSRAPVQAPRKCVFNAHRAAPHVSGMNLVHPGRARNRSFPGDLSHGDSDSVDPDVVSCRAV